MYKKPTTIAALELAENSLVCRAINEFGGPASTLAMQAVARILRRRPFTGQEWLQYLRDLAEHYAGEGFPYEWTVESIQPELLEKAFGVYQPQLHPALTAEEQAMKAFIRLRGEAKQRNARREPAPLKALDRTPFKGL